ncbi:MAG: enoyl-CoA hydratase-related protein [Promethearchaeota archaeon]
MKRMTKDELELGTNVGFEVARRIATITLNRPERGNAITFQMLLDVKKALQFCQETRAVRAVILTGRGTSFTTGMDVDSLLAGGPETTRKAETLANEITSLIYNGKPVISAINGKAMGDGVIYALASDYRIAVNDAYFQMPEVNLSIFPGTGCVVLMARVLGISWAKKILVFAERIRSERALEINLVDALVERQDQLMEVALQKAKFLASKDPTLVRAIKLSCNHLADKAFDAARKLEKFASRWFEREDKGDFLAQLTERLI